MTVRHRRRLRDGVRRARSWSTWRPGAELATAVSRATPTASSTAACPAPDDDVLLEPDWALQDPADYVAHDRRDGAGELLRTTGIDPADVVGVGIDFTACTMLPTTADGTPLCQLPELRREPHAWVKLWKHHAAQPEADRINALAAVARRGVAAALRRPDLVGVVLRQVAPDPRRGARRLRAPPTGSSRPPTGSSGS